MVNRNEDVADLIFKQKFEAQAKLKKQLRRRKLKRMLVVLLISFLMFFYFATDISKVKYINIYNNQVVAKSEIKKFLNLSLDSRLIINNPLLVKYKLLKHPLIKDAKVSFSLFKRNLNIEVFEIEVFAYRQSSDSAKLIMSDGSEVNLTSDFYPLLANLIYIEGFKDEADQIRLVESFIKLNSDVKNQISEIHQTSVSYDDKLLELRMNDGNKVYTSFQSVERLNYYFDIIINLRASNSCIYIDEMSGEAYSQPCISE